MKNSRVKVKLYSGMPELYVGPVMLNFYGFLREIIYKCHRQKGILSTV